MIICLTISRVVYIFIFINIDVFIFFFNILDELAGFEEAWKGNNIGQLSGWKSRYDVHRNEGKLPLFCLIQ